MKAEQLSVDEAKKLSRNVPGIRVGRLAVSKDYQRQGIGKLLLVEAKDQDAKRYYEQFEFVPLPSNELELFPPVRTIQDALGD